MAVAILSALAFSLWWIGVRSNWQPTPIIGVKGATDSRTLQVSVAHNECGTGDPRVNVEDGEVVVLTADFDQAGGSCDDIGLTTTIGVDLERALGDRAIEVRTLGRDVRCAIAGVTEAPCVRSPRSP